MWAHLRERPSAAAVLLLCALGVVLHQWVHWDFMIDDAGICFAYARNIAAGEGIVPWPGGERIEGFSDPTWIALLTMFELVGIPSIQVAKPLAMLFGVLTVPVTYRIARLAMPGDEGPAPLFAPIVLALSAQLAIWSASALENALWCLLLAIAIATTVEDAPRGRFLRSSLAWLLIAWTRPEGLVYATCGAFWFLVGSTQQRRPLRAFWGWMVVFWAPTFALEFARLWYFAWPLPNTWYAKLETRATFPLEWNQRGWGQLREFSTRLWQIYFAPLYVMGLLGLRGRQGGIALAVIGLGALLLLYPTPQHIAALPIWPPLPALPEAWPAGLGALGPIPSPRRVWLVFRIAVIAFTVVFLPFAAIIGRSGSQGPVPGWSARVLCWHTAGIAVLFSVYANGDWMGGYRWMSLMVPSAAVLFAVGLNEVVQRVERLFSGSRQWGTAGWTAAAFGVCAMIPPNYAQSRDHLYHNGDESVPRLKLRAEYTGSILERTFHEGPVYNLEMDMGGNLLFRPEYVQIDMAGLVDVPMSRHTYRQRSFIEEYVFEEHRPTFGHVHGWWAQFSAFPTYPQWSEYVALPPHRDIPPAPAWHDGMWAHRSLFSAPGWEGTPRRVTFDTGLVLEGFDVPGEIWAEGGAGFVELGFRSAPRAQDETPRVIAFLTDGARVAASWELQIGYGLFGVEHWADDVVLGRYALRIPGEVGKGRYELGLVALGGAGQVLEVEGAVPSGAVVGGRDVPAVFASGEVRFERAVTIAAPPDVEFLRNTVRDDVVALTEAGNCEAAEARWIDAKRIRLRDTAWQDSQRRREVGPRISDCWALRAEREAERAAEHLASAFRWDRSGVALERVGAEVGARLWAEGKQARSEGDWETAYRRFEGLLGFQPWRSWARRYAEEARNHRLGLQRDQAPPGVPARPGDLGEARAKAP
jgi:hypothetical protein